MFGWFKRKKKKDLYEIKDKEDVVMAVLSTGSVLSFLKMQKFVRILDKGLNINAFEWSYGEWGWHSSELIDTLYAMHDLDLIKISDSYVPLEDETLEMEFWYEVDEDLGGEISHRPKKIQFIELKHNIDYILKKTHFRNLFFDHDIVFDTLKKMREKPFSAVMRYELVHDNPNNYTRYFNL